MKPLRRAVLAAAAVPLLALTACQSGSTGTGEATPSAGATTGTGGPTAEVRFPQKVLLDTLPTATEVGGLVLSVSTHAGTPDERCVLVTVGADGAARKVRSFAVSNGLAKPPTNIRGCATPAGFTAGFAGMVGTAQYGFQDADHPGEPRVSVLGQGAPADLKDISGLPAAGAGTRQSAPVVDPVSGEVVHWTESSGPAADGRLRAVRPDGTGEHPVEGIGVRAPEALAFLGGRVVSAQVAKRAVANGDGSLTVAADDRRTVRVGPVATLAANPVAEVSGGVLNPKALVGDRQVLSADGRELALATVDTADPAHPRIALKPLATIPEQFWGPAVQEEAFVVDRAANAAYTTVQHGSEDQGQRVLVLRVDLATGAVSAVAMLLTDGGRVMPLAVVA
ncbi:hypothetical protein ACIF6L_08545 [Kitasatospora sp. NPDC086009]|uniref:hypothetical protein n=1 Tax=unclassified Kitasatospora TaxID=2633591 RepID=UPI0037C78CF4